MDTENDGRRPSDAEIMKWVAENSAELDRPLSNRGFLLGCSILAETMLFASSEDFVSRNDQKEWKSALSRLKSTFIKDWRGDA
jgi:hypothetical protein